MDKRNDYNSILKQQAKERAKNYMRLKDGYIEPKDVVLDDKTALVEDWFPKQERSYSEEDMREAIFTSFLLGVDRGNYSKELEDDLLKQFKKK
jgi:hypothetical protein